MYVPYIDMQHTQIHAHTQTCMHLHRYMHHTYMHTHTFTRHHITRHHIARHDITRHHIISSLHRPVSHLPSQPHPHPHPHLPKMTNRQKKKSSTQCGHQNGRHGRRWRFPLIFKFLASQLYKRWFFLFFFFLIIFEFF